MYPGTMSPEEWRARGEMLSLPDGRVFVLQMAAASQAVPVLLLHGFPTSSWDFAAVARALGEARPLIFLDFLGFGFSEKPRDMGYSLFEQADVVCQVVRHLGHPRVHLVAHDMGTSVATELLARRERRLLPFEVSSLTLMNGSVHIELASLSIGQHLLRSPLGPVFARINNRRTFKVQMRRIFGTPPSESDLDGMWDLVAREDGAVNFPKIIEYTRERSRFRRRWIGALERLDLPALVAWGRRDPIAVAAIAEALAREIPGAELVWWDDLGHYPQVEAPERVASVLREFVARA